MSNDQKVVLITGGASGIGRGLVEGFADSGYRVISVDRQNADTYQNTTHLEFDLSQTDRLGEIIEFSLKEFKTLDVLINNAAVSLGQSAIETNRATWDTTVAVNISAPFFLAQAAAKIFKEQSKPGVILNMASVNSFAAEKGHASYVTSKGAIAAMTNALAVDLAPLNIRVNAIAPGPVETSKTRPIFSQPEYANAIKKGIPMSRAAIPKEVADLALFLCSDSSKYLTGQVVKIDGGYLSYARLD